MNGQVELDEYLQVCGIPMIDFYIHKLRWNKLFFNFRRFNYVIHTVFFLCVLNVCMCVMCLHVLLDHSLLLGGINKNYARKSYGEKFISYLFNCFSYNNNIIIIHHSHENEYFSSQKLWETLILRLTSITNTFIHINHYLLFNYLSEDMICAENIDISLGSNI